MEEISAPSHPNTRRELTDVFCGLDLRVQKTYLALLNAFTARLEEKRFENITVGEICSRAMVRRATFYKHFNDKYEFFAFAIRHVRETFRPGTQCEGQPAPRSGSYIQILQDILDFLDENEARVRSVLKSEAFPILTDILSEQVYWDVAACMQEDIQKGIVLPSSSELTAQAYTGMLTSVAKWWFLNRKKISKEDVIQQAAALFPASVEC